MQYILTQEEVDALRNKEPQFDSLTMILHSIQQQLTSNDNKLKLYNSLINDLSNASQDGTTNAILNAWENRNGKLI